MMVWDVKVGSQWAKCGVLQAEEYQVAPDVTAEEKKLSGSKPADATTGVPESNEASTLIEMP